MTLYRVYADYDPTRKPHPDYYVFGETKKHVRQRFSEIITWLDIYGIEEMSAEEQETILREGNFKHIIF